MTSGNKKLQTKITLKNIYGEHLSAFAIEWGQAHTAKTTTRIKLKVVHQQIYSYLKI